MKELRRRQKAPGFVVLFLDDTHANISEGGTRTYFTF